MIEGLREERDVVTRIRAAVAAAQEDEDADDDGAADEQVAKAG